MTTKYVLNLFQPEIIDVAKGSALPDTGTGCSTVVLYLVFTFSGCFIKGLVTGVVSW